MMEFCCINDGKFILWAHVNLFLEIVDEVGKDVPMGQENVSECSMKVVHKIKS